ncbi:acyltransferase [Citrobacter portucalensis]|uniref:acyltransferase n=1 Tax=Citrobacter portucalensis TaxID=1639133 RepID=UPI0039FCA9F2|nr:acyltransferase [Citrobacter freundii]
MKHKILLIYSYLIRLLLVWLPDMPSIMRFRGFLYSLGMGGCGKNLQVSSTAVLRGVEKIICGCDIYIGPNAYIMSREKIIIQNEVLIAMNVVIVDANHGKLNGSYRYSRGHQERIILGKGSWIAANSVVTAGAVIPAGKVVPPCTVVRKQ